LRARIEINGAPATVYLVDAPCFSLKEGIYTYTQAEAARADAKAGHGYCDFFDMNMTLQKAALELIQALGARPDLIHCQDAHTAFIPAMMRLVPRYRDYFADIGAGITIHNAGPGYHQEIYDPALVMAKTELQEEVVMEGLHRSAIYPFIVGGLYAGFVNTVSENYAREIMAAPADDEESVGIGAAFRERGIALTGVTNGIDPADYDPTRPDVMNIAAAYNPLVGDMAGKALCRQALIEEINTRKNDHVKIAGSLVDGPGRVLITTISRLTAQKGVDRFIGAMHEMLDEDVIEGRLDPGVMFLILGAGDPRYQDELIAMAEDERYAGQVAVAVGYGPRLANHIYAGGDFFVNPAAFEPCGLTDYMAQLMGTVPVVHLVGGLVKVEDSVTGYGYEEHTSQALAATLWRAIDTFRNEPETHARIIQQAIERIFDRYTWDQVLRHGYMPLYAQAVRQTTGEA
jgi:starch synthase